MHCQTLVLGAGIVGFCSALHLQAAGHSVILLDRDEPGRGTSHGNAGLIERSSVIQLRRCEAIARTLYPLGERLDAEPWLGRRPCLPDMRPVIGPAPNHKGLWFNFGHAHHGLTLGPVCGRLLAEMISGATPFTDPAPYSAARFR